MRAMSSHRSSSGGFFVMARRGVARGLVDAARRSYSRRSSASLPSEGVLTSDAHLGPTHNGFVVAGVILRLAQRELMPNLHYDHEDVYRHPHTEAVTERDKRNDRLFIFRRSARHNHRYTQVRLIARSAYVHARHHPCVHT